MSVSLINGHIDDDVMTDEEIVKALECCCSPKVNACDDCPFHKRCYENNEWLEKEAIDLINRKNAEIERLNGENKAFGEIIKKQDDEISVLRKDLLKREDLEKSFSKTVKQFDKKLAKTVKLERAEAVKEFAEMLKEKAHRCDLSTDEHEYYSVGVFEIDSLVKEMVGEG